MSVRPSFIMMFSWQRGSWSRFEIDLFEKLKLQQSMIGRGEALNVINLIYVVKTSRKAYLRLSLSHWGQNKISLKVEDPSNPGSKRQISLCRHWKVDLKFRLKPLEKFLHITLSTKTFNIIEFEYYKNIVIYHPPLF